jgi:phytoene dehydrogenase-like protein
METVEHLIVGGGPAGLRAAQVLADAGREVLLVENDPARLAGGYFWVFPHARYTSIGAVAAKRMVPPAALRRYWSGACMPSVPTAWQPRLKARRWRWNVTGSTSREAFTWRAMRLGSRPR